MGNANSESDRTRAGQSGEKDLRDNALDGAERKQTVDHVSQQKTRNPDGVVRVDDEEDSLYSDGLELEDDTPPMGTNTPP
jgi:hypothetical protein